MEALSDEFELFVEAYSSLHPYPKAEGGNGKTKGEINSHHLIRLLQHLGFNSSLTFMDIGSLYGNLVGVIAYCYRCHAIGFDVQGRVVRWAKRMLKAALSQRRGEDDLPFEMYYRSASQPDDPLVPRLYRKSDFTE